MDKGRFGKTELDRQMREIAKNQYGIDIDPAVYDA